MSKFIPPSLQTLGPTMHRSAPVLSPASEATVSFEAQNWKIALDTFENKKGHKDKKKMAEFIKERTTPQDAKASCEEAQAKSSKQYAQALGGVLSKIEVFMKIGDLAIKSAPESIGLAWTGIRLCLHAVEDDFATFNLFSTAAADIIGILISCRAYGRMYGEGSKGPAEFQELNTKVVGYIPNIYIDILEFSYAMKKHMNRNTGIRYIRGLLTSAAAKFRPMIDGIKESERIMSHYASQATQQLSMYYGEETLHNQGTSLQNQRAMMTELGMVREAIDASKEINKIYIGQIRQLEEERKNMKKKTPWDKAKETFDDNVKRMKPSDASEKTLEQNKDRREKGTCEWIFELEQYDLWRTSGRSELLWVSGVAGLGKSILMSTIIDRLYGELKDSKDSMVQYFFCSDRDDATRLAAKVKEQLIFNLYELCLAEESCDLLVRANEVVSNFLGQKASAEARTGSQQKKAEKTIGFEDAYPSLAKILNKKVFLVIDAMDECADRTESQFLKNFQAMLRDSDLHLQVMVCSRPKTDIYNEYADELTVKVEDHNGPDIEKTAQSRLEGLPGLSEAERHAACKTIVDKAKGLFRCIDPAIEFLKKPIQRPIERTLEKLPVGLDEFYRQTLQQTASEYLELLKIAMTWSIFCELKPTVAEIMDDYSRAYAADVEGPDENPYENMDSTPGETSNLIADQIQEAGGSTFLEVTGRLVTFRHGTVKDFFLKHDIPAGLSSNHGQDQVCANCKEKAPKAQLWAMSEKHGHLRMALTLFRHLNSPLFQRRYLPQPSKLETNGESEVEKSYVDEDVSDMAPKADQHPASVNGIREATQEQDMLTTASGKSSPSDEHTLAIETRLSCQDEAPVFREERLNTIHGPSGSEAARTEDDNGHDGDEEDAKAGFNADVDQDYLTDDEDGIHVSDSDSFQANDEDSETGSDPQKITRYELQYWPHHLRSAEKLWPRNEREGNSDWEELYALAEQFLCKNTEAFHSWQRGFMELSENFEVDNILLNPLQVASAFGLTGLAEVLIDHGASAAAETEDGRSALWFAADQDCELLKLLLDNGATPNARKILPSSPSLDDVANPAKETVFPPPFHRLLWLNPTFDGVQLMLDRKADCTILDWQGMNAISWFSRFGSDPKVLKALLDNHGDINVQDQYGETPLHKLMNQDEVPLELLKEFLKSGASINVDDEESIRPLYNVCVQGNTEAAKILLEHGADIHDTDVYGWTALHGAAFSGHQDIVDLLIGQAASLTLEDDHGRTPFHLACQNGHVEIARSLLTALRSQGNLSIINKTMHDRRTPLSKSAGRGLYEIVDLLLAEADVIALINSSETPLKRTALHLAAYNGRNDVVKLLLEKGADATLKDEDGKTPLALCNLRWIKERSGDRESTLLALIDCDRETAAEDAELMANAAIKGSIDVIRKLIDAKADPTKQDEHGWTPLQLARQYGNVDATELLARRGAEVGVRPSKWVTDKEEMRLSEDGRVLEFKSEAAPSFKGNTILANHPIPAGIECFYYEIEIKRDVGDEQNPYLAIGFSTNPARLDRWPGLPNPVAPSFAYHGSTGLMFANSDYGLYACGGCYEKGDTVGCGVIYTDGVNGTIFYTRNGEPQGVACDEGVRGRLYPAVGVGEPAALEANFGNDLDGRPFTWALANTGTFDVKDVQPKVVTEVPVSSADIAHAEPPPEQSPVEL